MANTHAPQSHEYSASPEGQILDIRLRIVANAGQLFNQLPMPDGAEAPTEITVQRTVRREAMNPIFQQVMNNPELAQQAYDSLDDIERAA